MSTANSLKQKVHIFKDFSDERLTQLAEGSRVASFEANEAILDCGSEAMHFCVLLSGTVTASVIGDGGAREARVLTFDFDVGAGDYAARGVRDGATDAGRGPLCERRHGPQDEQDRQRRGDLAHDTQPSIF